MQQDVDSICLGAMRTPHFHSPYLGAMRTPHSNSPYIEVTWLKLLKPKLLHLVYIDLHFRRSDRTPLLRSISSLHPPIFLFIFLFLTAWNKQSKFSCFLSNKTRQVYAWVLCAPLISIPPIAWVLCAPLICIPLIRTQILTQSLQILFVWLIEA